jgi:hypothetical protein
MADEAPDQPPSPGPRVLAPWLLASPALPLLPIIIYAGSADIGTANSWSVFAIGAAAAVAAIAVGGILGFLFALPRTLEQDSGSRLLATNSNLDQVSDWLTKILVGLGLIELGRIGAGVGDLGDSMAVALGGGAGAKAFALSIVIYCAIDGFLLGYLWTRIVVSRELKEAAENLAKVTELNEALVKPLAPLPPSPPSPTELAPPPAPPASDAGATDGATNGG